MRATPASPSLFVVVTSASGLSLLPPLGAVGGLFSLRKLPGTATDEEARAWGDALTEGRQTDDRRPPELSTRDNVARAIYTEGKEGRGSPNGGVFLDIGSSVQGPEVFLKAVSMASNVGHPPTGLTTASFDIRPARLEDVDDERTHTYYYRDVKSVVHRIPAAFGGTGYYIQGDHQLTVPALYWKLVKGHEREGH